MQVAKAPEKVRVRLWTTHARYAVTDAPLAVPVNLGRYGLSEIVNHLLGTEAEPQPFDFIVNGTLVRGSLRKLFAEQRVSTEEVVAVEYVPAVSLSGESESVEVPAWVGCLDTRTDGLVLAGCYDGQLQLINASTMEVAAACPAHAEPIRGVTSWRMHPQKAVANQGPLFVATASKDHTVKVWGVRDPSGTKQAPAVVATLRGHINSVECVDYWDTNGSSSSSSSSSSSRSSSSSSSSGGQRVLLSGDFSGNVFGWNVGAAMDDDWGRGGTDGDDAGNGGRKAKKQKGDAGAAVPAGAAHGEGPAGGRELKPAFVLRAHAQSVTGLQARGTGSGAGADTRLFTCSWDHSLKEWDLERQDCVASFAGAKVTWPCARCTHTVDARPQLTLFPFLLTR